MTHILDTDHLGMLQRVDSTERAVIVLRINLEGQENICASVVSFHEQMLGANNLIQKARTPEKLIEAYRLMHRIITDYSAFEILRYEARAAEAFLRIAHLATKVGTMDLRIAAIALANDLTLVTANTSDFALVPGLRLENWTR